MRKITLLLTSLFVLFSFSFSLQAQTTVANGIKVSDSENEYWYYIENGHNAVTNKKTTNADGRFGALITSHGGVAKGNTFRSSIDFMHPNVDRGSQRWKIVESDESEFYYLVNENGEYFYLNGNAGFADEQVRVPELAVMKFGLTEWSTSPYYTAIKAKGSSYNLVGLNGGGTGYWGLETPTTAGGSNTMDSGLPANPRAWRFVPVEELDNFYPTIYPIDSESSDIIEWYFIKSLDPAQSDAPYLTVDGGTLKLNADKTAAAVYGFIGNGKSMTSNPTQGGSMSLIVPKADTSKYLSGTGLSDTKANWWLKHTIAPAYSNTPQATITDGRSGTSYKYLVSGDNNAATMLQATGADTGDGATVDTYNNKYAWTYERAYVVDVEHDLGVTLVGSNDVPAYVVEKNNSFTLEFTVNAHSQLVQNGVTIDGTPVVPDLSNGVYSITIPSVSAYTTIVKIETETSAYDMDVTSNEAIVWEETPINVADYSEPYTISFTLEDGYHTPLLIVNGKLENPTKNNNVYSYTIDSVEEPYTIKVNAFSENVLPVLKDNWVDGRTKNGNNNNMLDLRVQASSSGYYRVSYVEFDASSIDASKYEKVEYKMYFVSNQSDKSANPIFEMRTVPTDLPAIESMTANANGEADGVNTRFGESISDPVTFLRASNPGDELSFDITDYVLDNLSSSLRLQIAGQTDNDAGFYLFNSREGAAAKNDFSLFPVLFFTEKADIGTNIDNIKDTAQLFVADNKLTVVADGGVLVNIYSVSGQLIKQDMVNGSKVFELNKGIYLVKLADNVYKISI